MRCVKVLRIRAEPLTGEAFAPFGRLIGRPRTEPHQESAAYAYWDKIIPLDLSGCPAELGFLEARHRPFAVSRLERHRKATQTFIPFSTAASVLVVAPGNPDDDHDRPRPEAMRAFLLDGTTGYHLFRGVWHLSPFPIGPVARFVMVVRRDTIVDDQEIRDLGATVEVTLA